MIEAFAKDVSLFLIHRRMPLTYWGPVFAAWGLEEAKGVFLTGSKLAT